MIFQDNVVSKKRTNEFNFTTMIPQVDLFSFVLWRKSTTPKNHLEINWPLESSKSAGAKGDDPKICGSCTRCTRANVFPVLVTKSRYRLKGRIFFIFFISPCYCQMLPLWLFTSFLSTHHSSLRGLEKSLSIIEGKSEKGFYNDALLSL